MDIRDRRGLHNAAADRLANAKSAGTVVLIYAAIALGSSALVTLVNYVLGLQIDKTGGLSNMGLRSFLSTIQSVLPMVQSAVLLCVEVGYVAASPSPNATMFVPAVNNPDEPSVTPAPNAPTEPDGTEGPDTPPPFNQGGFTG